jgi:hypothetical protein
MVALAVSFPSTTNWPDSIVALVMTGGVSVAADAVDVSAANAATAKNLIMIALHLFETSAESFAIDD